MMDTLLGGLFSAFIFLTLFAYFPGYVFLYKTEVPKWWDLRVAVGMCFLLLVVSFGRLFLPLWLVVALYSTFVISLAYYQGIFTEKILVFPNITLPRLILALVLVLGIFVQASFFIPPIFLDKQVVSSEVYKSRDQSWHASLIKELMVNFPPQVPGFSGVVLKNYHYFYDLLVATHVSLFGGSVEFAIGVVYPLLLSLFMGISVYRVSTLITDKKSLQIFSVLLSYLGNNLSYVLAMLGLVSWHSDTFLLDQPDIYLFNQQTVLSISLLLYLFILISQITNKSKEITLSLCTSVFLACLINIKIYAFIVALLSCAILIIYKLAQKIIRKEKFKNILVNYSVLALGTFVFGGLVLLTSFRLGNSFIHYNPGWVINILNDKVVFPMFPKLQSYYQVYQANNHQFKLFILYWLFLLIFLVGNFNVKVLAFLSILRKSFWDNSLMMLLYLGLFIPLVFISFTNQASNPYNIIQFAPYSIICSTLLLSFVLDRFTFRSRLINLFLITTLVVVSIPTTIKGFESFSWKRDTYHNQSLVNILKYLDSYPSGNVLLMSQNYQTYETNFNSNLVGAVSGKRSLFADIIQLSVLQVDYKKRLDNIEKFRDTICSSPDSYWQLTKDQPLDYIVVENGHNIEGCLNNFKLNYKIIVSNSTYSILKKF